MIALADAIVLTVGWVHYHRVNLMKVPRAITVDDEVGRALFLEDLEQRVGGDPVRYLLRRLHEEDPHHHRLSLPDCYSVGGRPMLARPGACAFCDERRGWHERAFPPHFPSRLCESGRHPHCTCDYCF